MTYPKTHARILTTFFVLCAVLIGLATTAEAQLCNTVCFDCDNQTACEASTAYPPTNCAWMDIGEGLECFENSSCMLITNETSCDAYSLENCTWDQFGPNPEDGECVVNYPWSCGIIDNDTECMATDNCMWETFDGGECIADCMMITDGYNCTIYDCMWDGAVCKDDHGPPEGVNCSNFCFACWEGEEACNASEANCTWWDEGDGMGHCEFAGTTCGTNCDRCTDIVQCLGLSSPRSPTNDSLTACAYGSWGCFWKMPGADCSWECPACETSGECATNSNCAWETTNFNGTDYGYCNFAFGGNCNVDCWGCSNVSECNNSQQACRWMDDPQGGHCEYDGGGNCFSFCGDCWEEDDCNSSGQDCQWIEPPWNPGFYECTRSCDDDCWNCFTNETCSASSRSCEWDDVWENCYETWVPDCTTNCYDCWDQTDCENSTGNNDQGCWWDQQWHSCNSNEWDICDSRCHACQDNESCENESRTWMDCTWVDDDSFCYEPYEAVDCAPLTQWDCNDNPNCEWDFPKSECRPWGGGGDMWAECSSKANQTECNYMEQCYWNHSNLTTGQFCVFKCRAGTLSQCEALGSYCSWDWGMDSAGNCTYIWGMGGCYAYPTQTECLTQSWCMWEENGQYCIEEGMTCGPGLCHMCYTDGDCNGAGDCYWDGWNSMCYQGGGGFEDSPCRNETLNQTQCESIPGCIYLGAEEGCDTMMPCEVISDMDTCHHVMGCDWNGSDCMDQCEVYDNQSACNGATGCSWETFGENDTGCVPFHNCGFNPDQWVCEEDPNCDWDSWMGQCIVPPICAGYLNQTACDTNPSCAWISAMGRCKEFCFNITNGTICNQTAGCFQDNMMGDCLAKMPCQTINISNQSGVNLCNGVEKCFYDEYGPNGAFCAQQSEVAFQGGVNCDGFHDQYSCESMGQGDCMWTGFQCVYMDGGGTGPTCDVDCGFCYDPSSCANSPLGPGICGWDFQYGFCYWNGTGDGGNPCDDNCFNCWDDFSCYGSPAGCTFDYNTWTCSSSLCDIKCSYCGGDRTCAQSDVYKNLEKNWSCAWSYENNTCRKTTCAEDCRSCFNQTGCEASSASCEWNDSAPNDRRKCTYASDSTSTYACNYGCVCNENTTTQNPQDACWNAFTGCEWHGPYWDPYPSDPNEYCFKNTIRELCRENCSQCNVDWMCWDNWDCSWDYGPAQCVWGSSGNSWTCSNDCWSCWDEIDCNNSNATGSITSLGEGGGCAWTWDSWMQQYNCQDSRFSPLCENTDPMICFDPNSTCTNQTTEQDCFADSNGCFWDFMMQECRPPCPPVMCEACATQFDCENLTHTLPYMGPWAPAFDQNCGWEWDPWMWNQNGTAGAYVCRPDFGGGAAGPGAGCFNFDFTSRDTCESNAGCMWDSVTLHCIPDMSDIPCEYLCKNCDNESRCEGNPMCNWENVSGFCMEDWTMFNFGGDCNSKCYDCFEPSQCNGSSAGCKWINDPMGWGPGWCATNNTPTCDSDCFMCWDNESCVTIGTPNQLIQATIAQMNLGILAYNCSSLTNETECDTQPTDCEWNGTECIEKLIDAESCEWDEQYWVCKPAGMDVEVCFIPGDEDNDGLWDCADPDCGMDPFCGFGFGGGPGGTGGMGSDCPQWDERNGGNQTTCENGTSMNETTGCCWHQIFNGDWLCDPCFNDQFFAGMEEGPPTPLGPPDAPCNGQADDLDPAQDWINICDIGVRETDNILGLVAHVVDWPPHEGTRDLVLCNYVNDDCENRTGKYYFYLDTDKNQSTGCDSKDGLWAGFEYELAYLVNQTLNGTTNEERWVKRCNNATGNFTYKSATLSGKKDETCQFNGVYLAIDKGDLANLQDDMRICVATANESGDDANPVDVTDTCVYYTPGAADFNPPDCFANPTACGSGFDGDYFKGEDCIETPQQVDEDGDGLVDCEDPDCYGAPWCSGGYNCEEDTSYPETTYNTVDKFKQKAIVNWKTNEPTYGTLRFFGTVNGCSGNYTNETEGEDQVNNFHNIELDNLTSNATYFYKIRSCDEACDNESDWEPNCATSKCLNFTTKLADPDITMGYSYQPPTANPTDPLGRLSITMDCDQDGLPDFNISAGNATSNETKSNCTLELTNPTSTEPWCLRIYGAKIYRGFQFAMTGAVFVNETNGSNSTEFVVGLDTQKWNQLLQNLGATYVGICLPNDNISICDDGAACEGIIDCENSTAGLVKCDNTGILCSDVSSSGDVTLCNETQIDWKVPVSLGFSVYGVQSLPPPPTTTSSTTTTVVGSTTSTTSTTSTIVVTTCPIGEWCLPDYLYSGWNLISMSFVP
ncbi:MAG: hypothetical protein ABH950_01705 [Candidatus Altiarchaeota archaeon]